MTADVPRATRRLSPWIWVIVVIVAAVVMGLAISGMHYTGMAAYHVDGIVEWNTTYIAASVLLSVVFACLAVSVALNERLSGRNYWAAAVLVLAAWPAPTPWC